MVTLSLDFQQKEKILRLAFRRANARLIPLGNSGKEPSQVSLITLISTFDAALLIRNATLMQFTNTIIHHSSKKIVRKDIQRLERTLKNWKDLRGLGRIGRT